jgi:hypothetical protein
VQTLAVRRNPVHPCLAQSDASLLRRPSSRPGGFIVWKTWWFNIAMLLAYSGAGFALAGAITPDKAPQLLYVYGGALAYGCGNVHFVLWFTFFTRERNAKQFGQGDTASDELDL